ncbi:MAG: hypothetical protein ABIV10_12575 [Gemmatimonadaceae bacterium]
MMFAFRQIGDPGATQMTASRTASQPARVIRSSVHHRQQLLPVMIRLVQR